MGRDDDDEEEGYRIDDDDGGTEVDGDICDRCFCSRSDHEDGKGECKRCGRCRAFRDP